MNRIPYNKVWVTEAGRRYVDEVLRSGKLVGGGKYTELCETWFEQQYHCPRALLVHSATHALYISSLLMDLKPGDEVIMPSFTFVTAAQVVVLRGAIPVFVDARGTDFNIDPAKIEPAVTARTRMIMPMHYAGVPCEMDRIIEIAAKYQLAVVEDASQAVLSRNPKDAYLGTAGQFGCLSFHETKNLAAGEGGILLVNSDGDVDRAEMIRDKGTNRRKFDLGLVDKYTWSDLGLSFLPPEITAALLFSQLERAPEITSARQQLWLRYQDTLAEIAVTYNIQLPDKMHNAHIFYCVFEKRIYRDRFIEALGRRGVSSVFHYTALHLSPMGTRFGRVVGDMTQTARAAECLVRLPLWYGLEKYLDHVLDAVVAAIHEAHT